MGKELKQSGGKVLSPSASATQPSVLYLRYLVRLLTASLSVIFICGPKCVESSSGERMDNKEMSDKDSTPNIPQSALLPSVFC